MSATKWRRLTPDDKRLMRELRQWGRERLAEIDAAIAELQAERRAVRASTSVEGIAEKFGCHRMTASEALRGRRQGRAAAKAPSEGVGV